jgi:TctA family transporter
MKKNKNSFLNVHEKVLQQLCTGFRFFAVVLVQIMSCLGFVRLVVCFCSAYGGTSAPIFRVMELVQMETVLSVKRRDSTVHGVRTQEGAIV